MSVFKFDVNGYKMAKPRDGTSRGSFSHKLRHPVWANLIGHSELTSGHRLADAPIEQCSTRTEPGLGGVLEDVGEVEAGSVAEANECFGDLTSIRLGCEVPQRGNDEGLGLAEVEGTVAVEGLRS